MIQIAQVKMKDGEVTSLRRVDLDKVVTKMKDDSLQKATQRVAESALLSRLSKAQGGHYLPLEGGDTLPYLIFGATFGRGGLNDVRSLTGLLLLTIDCRQGQQQVMSMKRKVQELPYTLLAFAGASGVTLKVVVRVDISPLSDPSSPITPITPSSPSSPITPIPPTDQAVADYLALMRDARECACSLYQALTRCDFIMSELELTTGCRMSYDPQLYYNPQAIPVSVVRHDDNPLLPYAGTQVEDDGEVVLRPEDEVRSRLKMEYETCLSKALDLATGQDHCLQLLADYCAKAQLAEESCVLRTLMKDVFCQMEGDEVRKVFRNAYKAWQKKAAAAKGAPLKPLSQMNEKERIMRSVEDFLTRRYQLRYNVVKQVTEFRPNDLMFRPWQPLTDRQMRSIVVEEMKEGGESWMNDIRTYIESAHIPDYNPVLEFLAGCGEWDGKHDYIGDFARRLHTNYALWPTYFHRWFLAMVAQALNKNRDYGNSMVPMLIGPQGYKKSTFCKNILPPSMREYYMDDIKMDNAEQVERVLGRMWLVNIDEYNAKTSREQAKIKRLLTEKDVQVRRMRSAEYTMTPRLCSFIATTNDLTPLPSGDGSRRYLCVEVTGVVDMSGRIPYKQMFAQAVAELKQRDTVYWFTSDDERAIQQHNSHYQEVPTAKMILTEFFEPAPTKKKEYFWKVSRIQKELGGQLSRGDVPGLKEIGLALKALAWPKGGIDGASGYYLLRKK